MKKIYLFLLLFLVAFTGKSQCPTFIVFAPSGTVIGCNPPTVPLNALNTSTLSSITYTWVSAVTGATVGSSINATAPGGFNTYTVLASSPSSTCIFSQIVSVSQNTITPTITVSPISRTLTCGSLFTMSPCQSFTATTSSGTANIVGSWYNTDYSTIISSTVSPMSICVNAPGTYTAEFCSTVSGCCATQTVAVYPALGMPTISVTVSSFNGFTINCTNPKVIMNCNTNSTTGPFSYTWTPLPSGPPVPSTVGGYTATTPGQYQIKFIDGNLCPVASTVNVYIDTLRPTPSATTNLPSNSFTLNCYNDTLIATAITATMLASSNYSWTIPGPLTSTSNTILVTLANITSSTAPTVYTVSAMNWNGCVGKSKVYFYKDIFVPPLSVIGNTAICIGQSATLTASGLSSYTWSTGSNSTTVVVSPTINTTYTVSGTNAVNGCKGQKTITVTYCTGITEISDKNNVLVSPNPSSGQFFFSGIGETVFIEVFDINGKLVYSATIDEEKQLIDLSGKPKGIYLYKIKDSNNKIQQGKLIIE